MNLPQALRGLNGRKVSGNKGQWGDNSVFGEKIETLGIKCRKTA